MSQRNVARPSGHEVLKRKSFHLRKNDLVVVSRMNILSSDAVKKDEGTRLTFVLDLELRLKSSEMEDLQAKCDTMGNQLEMAIIEQWLKEERTRRRQVDQRRC